MDMKFKTSTGEALTVNPVEVGHSLISGNLVEDAGSVSGLETMQVGALELRRTDEGWQYQDKGVGGDLNRWCDATDVLGPFGGSGVNDLLDELSVAKEEVAQGNCDAAVAAIQFALHDDEGMQFLHLWNEGDFDVIRREWPDAPEEVFIGADPLYKPA
jgi:hypothetical protein